MKYRRDHDFGAKDKLVFYRFATLILLKINKEGTHGWQAVLAGNLHLFMNIRSQPFAQEQQLTQNVIGGFSKRPDFIVRATFW
jgi:hypothetical protein